MAESLRLRLIMEKGPREGETLEYAAGSVVKIGRIVRGNTIAIKDAGISSKHICIQFDNELSRWTVSDLDSSNGTILNGQSLEPNVPSCLKDGDCIKIGEITSIIVRIGVEATNRSERSPRRQGKSGTGAVAVVVDPGRSGLGLGLDGDFSKNAVEEPVERWNLRSRAKKAVDSKDEVESLSSRRTLRSTRKEENTSFIPTLKQIPGDLDADERKRTGLSVIVEGKKARGRGKKNLPAQPSEDSNLDEKKTAGIVVPTEGKMTQRGGTRGRKRLPVQPLSNEQNSGLEENLNQVDVAEELNLRQGACKGMEVAVDKYPGDPLEDVENSGMEKNLDNMNESVRDRVAEEMVPTQECKRKEAEADESSLKREAAVQVDVDKGNEVAEALAYRQDSGRDNSQWPDLDKMTLGDFFDYLEVQLSKEIHEKSEKIISDLTEKARKCHEFRLQRNGNGKEKRSMI